MMSDYSAAMFFSLENEVTTLFCPIFTIQEYFKFIHTFPGRGFVKKNVRLAVNSGERNIFHSKVPASYSVESVESSEFW